jgi:hypothetical protein
VRVPIIPEKAFNHGGHERLAWMQEVEQRMERLPRTRRRINELIRISANTAHRKGEQASLDKLLKLFVNFVFFVVQLPKLGLWEQAFNKFRPKKKSKSVVNSGMT